MQERITMAKRGNREGSIYKRADGRWEAAITLEGGKRKRHYARTRQEASVWLAAATRDRDRGLLPIPERQTLAQFLTDWLAVKRATLHSPRTYDRYEEVVRLHLLPSLGKVPLVKLTAQQVQRLYNDKLDAGLSATTVHHIHAVLHTALAAALRQAVVQRNVADLVEKPRMRRRQMTTWTPEQARAFLAAAADDRLYALYVVGLSTAMRQAELFGLRWRDIDLDGASLSITTAVQRSRLAGLRFAEPKTASGRRHIALSGPTVTALRAHRARQMDERLALGPAWQDLDLVFPNTVGGPLQRSNLEFGSFRPLLRTAGVPRIRFHDLRHTAATLLLLQGIHPKVVSEMLGHASVAITLDLYSHVLPNMQRQAADELGRLLGSSWQTR